MTLYLVLLFSLFFPHTIANEECVPVRTGLTHICSVKCLERGRLENTSVDVFNCSQTVLDTQTSATTKPELVNLIFDKSNLTTVPENVLSGYMIVLISFEETFITFHSRAFMNFAVVHLKIKKNRGLKILPSGLFRGPSQFLYSLDLSKNALEALPCDIFQGLSILCFLQLHDNKLKSLSATLFADLSNLTYLEISTNDISCLAFDLFHPLMSLKRLFIRNMIDIKGLCPQTFKGLSPELTFNGNIDKCVIECGVAVTGTLTTTHDNEECDCTSMKGCLDSVCWDIEINEVVNPTTTVVEEVTVVTEVNEETDVTDTPDVAVVSDVQDKSTPPDVENDVMYYVDVYKWYIMMGFLILILILIIICLLCRLRSRKETKQEKTTSDD